MIPFRLWLMESKSVKPTHIGKYKIVYVDSKKFRNSSLENEEFCTVAIHEDFPKSIKKNEIYIDDSVKAHELPSLLLGLKVRLQDLENLNGSEKSYENGQKAEKSHRKKHKDKITKVKCCILHDYKNDIQVYYVDGKSVRDNYKTDFSQGGHGYVYKWIPKDEIWIEKEEKEETQFILSHEYTEMVMMRDMKIAYEKAHSIASKIEKELRETNFKMNDIIKLTRHIKSLF